MDENCELYDLLEQFKSYEEVIEAIRIYKIHEESWEDTEESE